MRLRQVVMVADTLSTAVDELLDLLGLRICFRDPRVSRWGLVNAVMPAGGDFLEILAPAEAGASAGRYLARRGGPGGYMFVLQCNDALAERQRVGKLGVRDIWGADRPDYVTTHFHPNDLGGVLLSIDSVPGCDYRAPFGQWPPAGSDWGSAIDMERTEDLIAVELQSDDPAGMAIRWSRILELPVQRQDDTEWQIRLVDGSIRFVRATDGRGAGIGAFDLKARDPAAILAAAEARGARSGETQLVVCGTRINLR